MSGFQPWLIQKGSGIWYECVSSPHAKHRPGGEKGEGLMSKPWGRIFTDFLQLPAGSLSLAGIFSGTRCTNMFLIQKAAGDFIAERLLQHPPMSDISSMQGSTITWRVCDIPLYLLEELAWVLWGFYSLMSNTHLNQHSSNGCICVQAV